MGKGTQYANITFHLAKSPLATLGVRGAGRALVAIFYFASTASLLFTSVGVVVGVTFALLVRKWRELN